MDNWSSFADLEGTGHAQLDVTGMWCTSCSKAVEKALSQLKGVLKVHVHYAGQSLEIHWEPKQTNLREIQQVVTKLGYGLLPQMNKNDRMGHLKEMMNILKNRWLISLVIYSLFWVSPFLSLSQNQHWIIDLILASVVVFWCGSYFLKAGWRTLKAKSPGMDFLVSLGALAAYGLSIWQYQQHIYQHHFKASTMIVGFLLLGRWLEQKARKIGFDSVERLFVSGSSICTKNN